MLIDNKSIELDLSGSGENLYIFFGGISAGLGMPIFEFYNASKILNDKKIFCRDFSQTWYHNGLVDVGNDIKSIVKILKKYIQEINPKRVYFCGNSMGGFAAIMFATLIGKESIVIAFSPQTFISPMLRFKYNDFRWNKQILNTYKKSIFKHKIYNLRSLIAEHKNAEVKIHIFVAKDDQLDYVHSQHIKSLNNVLVYEFEWGGMI